MSIFRVRGRRAVTIAAVSAVLVLAATAPAPVAPGPVVSVVVQGRSGVAAASAVRAAGGTVVRSLGLVGGVAAEVTEAEAEALARDGFEVTPDVRLDVASAGFETASTDVHLQAVNPGPSWGPAAGEGVGVALIDTGVTDGPDLDGRLVRGPDLSGDGDGVDRYGHGTFMAGLIAGDGSASAGGSVRHAGVAPGAHVVSVKVAGRDGVTSLSRVLAAIGWVVEHAPEHDIGVLNLSFGVDSRVAWPADPLSVAVEAAWASGITVVVAAGNDGAGAVTSPGRDPWVITAGASDPHGTPATSDDTVPSWSAWGRIGRFTKPDLVAPGVSVVSLRAPGSAVDDANPAARVGDAYFRGSGTSMAAAVTSGAAAVLLAEHPQAAPDDVKGALLAAADPVAGSVAGALDLAGADTARSEAGWWQQHPLAGDGSGALQRVPWSGDGQWDTSRWYTSRWYTADWSTSRWYTSRWYAGEWRTSRWYTSRWYTADWSTSRWYTSRWYTSRWYTADWSTSRWYTARWSWAP